MHGHTSTVESIIMSQLLQELRAGVQATGEVVVQASGFGWRRTRRLGG